MSEGTSEGQHSEGGVDAPSIAVPAAHEGGRPGPGGAACEETGVAAVDAALRRLAQLPDRTVHEHAQLFSDVHSELVATLQGAADSDSPTHPTPARPGLPGAVVTRDR